MDTVRDTPDSAGSDYLPRDAGESDPSAFAARLAAVRGRLSVVRGRLAAATSRAGRPADSVKLLPVSKTLPAAAVLEAYALGLRDFGENRVQEMGEKAAQCPADIRWHLIGHLQRNKARAAAHVVASVQSVDSVRLAEALDAAAAQQNRVLPVLIEINATGEPAKGGVPLDGALDTIAAIARQCMHLRIDGLMTIGPRPEFGAIGPNERATRTAFAAARRLSEAVLAARLPRVLMGELSMGMSSDLEWAIDEGSTMVRVGTALFGQRSVR